MTYLELWSHPVSGTGTSSKPLTRVKYESVFRTIQALAFASVMTSVRAQEVSIPDSGLNVAVRAALAKPTGPLTVQDLTAGLSSRKFYRARR